MVCTIPLEYPNQTPYCIDMNNAITYRRIQHAAHYAYAPVVQGHDLEQWDCPDAGERSKRTGDPLRPGSIPRDAKYHSGYIAKDGTQRWLFVRIAPLTGTCPRCSK